MFISLLTNGYFYGLIASLVGAFCINYFFMFPYRAFSLSYSGYPVAMVSMTLISGVVCALTSRVKLQAVEAMKREQDTKASPAQPPSSSPARRSPSRKKTSLWSRTSKVTLTP